MITHWTIAGQEGTLTVKRDDIGFHVIQWEAPTVVYRCYMMVRGGKSDVWTTNNDKTYGGATAFGKLHVHPEFAALVDLMR